MAKNSKGIEVAEVLSDKCIGCQICIGQCPVEAIELSPDGVAQINPEICVGCGRCFEICPVEAVAFDRSKRLKPVKGKTTRVPEPAGGAAGVAVFIEVDEASVAANVSWELVSKARELAAKRKTRVIGLLLGTRVERVVREAGAQGCDEVHSIDHPRLEHYLSALYGSALTELVSAVNPEILLIGATSIGRDLSAVVATRLQTGLTADCTGLDIDEETGLLLMTRPTFGGNIMATITCQHRRPQMSTVRPKVMAISALEETQEWKTVKHDWSPPEISVPELMELVREQARIGVDITKVSTLVVAGKGACDRAGFPMLEELAAILGGTVACSRPVVEAGLMPYERQVGQTGKTVAPKLYIGVGVSGAIQHRVAIQGAEKILAINTDPAAPIFQIADAGIVGDYAEVVPELIAQLKKRLERDA